MAKASSTPIVHFLLAAGLFLSCSAGDDLSMSHPQGEPHAVEVSMRVGVSAGIASCELNTWDGAQQVNDMRIYLFRCPQEKYNTEEKMFTYYIPQNIKDKGYFEVKDFDNKTPYYSSEHNGQPEQHAFYFSPFLESGYYYQFLAVGRDDKYVNSQDRLLEEQPSFKEGVTTLQDAKMSLAENAVKQAENGTYKCSEFFSGVMRDETTKNETPILVTDEPPYFFRATLTATRNVAGLMIYVTNIPSIVETNTTNASTEKFTPTKLYVEATGLATETKLIDRIAPTSAKIYKTQTLGEIDFTTANGWTIDEKEHVFIRPADKEKGWQKNSYLVSNFMMPTPESFMGNSPNAEGLGVTFYLHYTDDKGHHRYDNIKMTKSTGDLRRFPIEANHLYSLGSKSSTTNDPYDLQKHYEPIMVDIAIEIEPAFEKKHEFETE